MKLTAHDKDTLRSFVLQGDNMSAAKLIKFLEDKFDESSSGFLASAVEDLSAGGSDPSVEESARKRSSKKS